MKEAIKKRMQNDEFMSEAEWLNIFGDNLRDILAEQWMSQEELAEATGISEGTISKYVNKKLMPSMCSLIKMSRALSMTLDELMDFGCKVYY